MHSISGPFDVSMHPQPGPEPADGITLGRALLDKRYHGPLQATGVGQMLSAVTATAGSAGYVAVERVSGTLEGRAGSFVLQHHGLMNRGDKQLGITVVPDSGTGALAGISGRMGIRIEGGAALLRLRVRVAMKPPGRVGGQPAGPLRALMRSTASDSGGRSCSTTSHTAPRSTPR